MTKLKVDKETLDIIIRDLNNTFYLSPYEGFQIAWDAIIKMANHFQQNKKLDRMVSLLNIIPDKMVEEMLSDSAVDELLNVRPLLKTLLSSKNKSINDDRISYELKELVRLRTIDPRAALNILIVILKRIGDHRVHGFETQEGSRDEVIFRSSLRLLYRLGGFAAECLRANQ
jgi:hypothetical protein